MNDQVLFTFYGEELLTEEENRKLWIRIVNHGVESLDKESSCATIACYFSTKMLCLSTCRPIARWCGMPNGGPSRTYVLDTFVRC